MKRLTKVLFVLTLILCVVYKEPISALESQEKLVYTKEFSPYDALYEENGDKYKFITKEAIQIGIDYENKLNESNVQKTGGYQWYLTGQETYCKNEVLRGYYFSKVLAGVNPSVSVSKDFTIGGTIKGVPIEGTYGFTLSIEFAGPSATERVGDYYANYRMYYAVVYGTIIINTYQYRDRYTGHVASTKVVYTITNRTAEAFSNLAFVDSSDLSVTIRNMKNDDIQEFVNENEFITKVNSSDVIEATNW